MEAAANKAVELTGADVIRIITKEEPKGTGLKAMLKGGHQALSGFKPIINVDGLDLSAYDTIILGTPVWAGTYAPAMRTFLENYPLRNKKIFLMATSASGDAKKMLEQLETILENNAIIGEVSLKDPAKHPKELEKLSMLKELVK
jgi:multimeric flavodoxin WrbA